MRHLLATSLVLATVGLLAGCSADTPTSRAVPAPPASLATHVLAPVDTPLTQEWDGRIEAIDNATLAAQTGGRVAELPFDVGDVVEEGAVVVRFTAVEQQSGQRQAQAALAAARAAADEATANFHRVEDVYARRLVARAEYDRAKAALDSAQAQLASTRAGLRSADEQVGYTAIRAPYRGVVTARFVQPGETVVPGQPLLSGVSLDRLRVLVEVPQALAIRLKPDTPAYVLTDDGRRIPATRITVFPQADPASHAVGVRLDLPEGESGLMPGMSAKAVFEVGSADTLSVPEAALTRRGEIESVFVLQPDGLISLRQVRTGRHLDGNVEVLAGLASGDTIALDAEAALAARREQRAAMAGH